MPLLIIVGIALGLGVFAILITFGRPSRESVVLAEVTGQAYQAEATAPRPWLRGDYLAKPFAWFRGLFGGQPNSGIARRLAFAGYRQPHHADIFVGVKLILPVLAGIAVGIWVSNDTIFWFVIVLPLAFFAPEFWLNRAIKQHRLSIKRSLPDALDLLSICMESGMGIDQAIVRVGVELKISHPQLSHELIMITLEQRAGNPRLSAWRNMADRVDIDSVRSFVNMLVQTERFGTPISKALSTFSETLRTQRRQQAEEKAAKTTIKLVLPLVFFIFPSIFIVTVVPAVLTVMGSFGTVL
jgi:tight adherence protein C